MEITKEYRMFLFYLSENSERFCLTKVMRVSRILMDGRVRISDSYAQDIAYARNKG